MGQSFCDGQAVSNEKKKLHTMGRVLLLAPPTQERKKKETKEKQPPPPKKKENPGGQIAFGGVPSAPQPKNKKMT